MKLSKFKKKAAAAHHSHHKRSSSSSSGESHSSESHHYSAEHQSNHECYVHTSYSIRSIEEKRECRNTANADASSCGICCALGHTEERGDDDQTEIVGFISVNPKDKDNRQCVCCTRKKEHHPEKSNEHRPEKSNEHHREKSNEHHREKSNEHHCEKSGEHATPYCPDGWLLLPSQTKCVYTPPNTRRTWADARQYCKNIHSDLVSIHNLTDDTFIHDMIATTENPTPTANSYWIGGYTVTPAAGNKLGWNWTDGTPFDIQNWSSGQPDNNFGYCAGQPEAVNDKSQSCLGVFLVHYAAGNLQWDDECCSIPELFICEKRVKYCDA